MSKLWLSFTTGVFLGALVGTTVVGLLIRSGVRKIFDTLDEGVREVEAARARERN